MATEKDLKELSDYLGLPDNSMVQNAIEYVIEQSSGGSGIQTINSVSPDGGGNIFLSNIPQFDDLETLNQNDIDNLATNYTNTVDLTTALNLKANQTDLGLTNIAVGDNTTDILNLTTDLSTNYTNTTDLTAGFVSKDISGNVVIAGKLTADNDVDLGGLVRALADFDMQNRRVINMNESPLLVDNAVTKSYVDNAVQGNTDRLDYSSITLVNDTSSLPVPASRTTIPFTLETSNIGSDFTSNLTTNEITVNANMTLSILGSIVAVQTGAGAEASFDFILLINDVEIGDKPRVVFDEATATYTVTAPRVPVVATDVIRFEYETLSSGINLETTVLHYAIEVVLTELIN